MVCFFDPDREGIPHPVLASPSTPTCAHSDHAGASFTTELESLVAKSKLQLLQVLSMRFHKIGKFSFTRKHLLNGSLCWQQQQKQQAAATATPTRNNFPKSWQRLSKRPTKEPKDPQNYIKIDPRAPRRRREAGRRVPEASRSRPMGPGRRPGSNQSPAEAHQGAGKQRFSRFRRLENHGKGQWRTGENLMHVSALSSVENDLPIRRFWSSRELPGGSADKVSYLLLQTPPQINPPTSDPFFFSPKSLEI